MTATKILWIDGSDCIVRSHPTPDHPTASRYVIVPEQIPPVDGQDFTLFDAGSAVMVGTLPECKSCAEALENEPLCDWRDKEEVRELSELTPGARTLIELTRRAYRSGERLHEILDSGMPPHVVEHELKILNNVADQLSRAAFLADVDQVVG